ncbi:N-glycosylase/DNA lyase [Candidatus Woesearchaeota archaeon]|nr:N-glycosylase/DNA lyase [Candidatus Woesearchaeota archaeon]
MKRLIEEVEKLKNSPVKEKVTEGLARFHQYKNLDEKQWFSELCFCILTANSKQETAIKIQDELGAEGFANKAPDEITKVIIKHKHRFHNNKTRFIVEARPHIPVLKGKVNELGEHEAREWIVMSIKGLGYKEASHFLRNTGAKNLAILDRHVLSMMVDYGLLREKPKALSRKIYLEIEEKFNTVARKLDITPAELDMYVWYMKVNDVYK